MRAPYIEVVADADGVARASADLFARLATDAVRSRGRCTVALAGGSTPLRLYRRLAGADRQRVPWEALELFWGDERHVGPDHPDSNFRASDEALIGPLGLPADRVHRMHGENPDAAAAAADYERTLRESFGLDLGQVPMFDVVLLGLGTDGHTASIFPGTDVVHESRRLVAAPWIEKLGVHRITLTPLVLNRAAAVMFLVAGPEKADVLGDVLRGPYQPDVWPAQVIRPVAGTVSWLVDRSAASRIPHSLLN